MRKYQNKNFIKNFGINLRAIRKKKEITQERLCELTGLALSQIGRIERGEINTSIEKVKTIADALEIEPYKLFLFGFEEKL